MVGKQVVYMLYFSNVYFSAFGGGQEEAWGALERPKRNNLNGTLIASFYPSNDASLGYVCWICILWLGI